MLGKKPSLELFYIPRIAISKKGDMMGIGYDVEKLETYIC